MRQIIRELQLKLTITKHMNLMSFLESIPKGKTPLLVMLDGLEDPHNLGAILRTCDCVGVDGVIIGKHRNVKLTPTVAKVSTGAIDTVKVSMVTNLAQSIKYLKNRVIGLLVQTCITLVTIVKDNTMFHLY